jgi:hypothetical protein
MIVCHGGPERTGADKIDDIRDHFRDHSVLLILIAERNRRSELWELAVEVGFEPHATGS